ncbi:MAG: DSD1 family PLP-dependent enzyme [Deltaproteobacteria bacterium]|nr:DSD1 family PLP-dependent enzyme [Deltaproteobacteria bacterium]
MVQHSSPQSAIGLSKSDLPTPALLIDLDLLEANIAKMAAHAKSVGINLRPHAKSHKCPEIAKRQIAAGAVGICAATISEAEALADAGIPGIHITSPMAGREKSARLVQLTARQPDVMAVVDNAIHAQQLNDAASSAKVTLNILVDIDPGMHRTGIPAGEGAIALVELISRLPHLRLRGLQCYSGTTAHVLGYEARREHSLQAMTPTLELFAELRKRGLPLEIMTGGSTGTYNIDCSFPGMTELQVGSYVFMDIEYRDIGGQDGPVYRDFAHSLTVLSTVVSRSHADLATVDAGLKAFATDRQFGPEPKDISGVKYNFGGDEHGILAVDKPSREIKLGDKLEFLVPHCDPNVNLYDRVFCVRGDRVEAVWPIVRGFR